MAGATSRKPHANGPSRWPDMPDPGVLANSTFVLAWFGEDIGTMLGLVDRALALNPSFARGWYLSGLLRTYAGMRDRAIEHVETAMRLSPHFFKRQ